VLATTALDVLTFECEKCAPPNVFSVWQSLQSADLKTLDCSGMWLAGMYMAERGLPWM
jgi:hypothetical protein